MGREMSLRFREGRREGILCQVVQKSGEKANDSRASYQAFKVIHPRRPLGSFVGHGNFAVTD